MTPEDQLNPDVTVAEIGAALKVLYPETFQAIGEVIFAAKRLALIAAAPDEVD